MLLPPASPASYAICVLPLRMRHNTGCCFFGWLQGGMPEEAHLALVDALVRCTVRAMPAQPDEAAKYGLIACRHLSGEEGILAWLPKHHNGRALFAMRRVRQLVAAAAAAAEPARPQAAGQGADVAPTPVQQLLAELVGVVDDCMVNLAEAEAKTGEQGPRQKLSSWQLRVALAEALVALLRADSKLLQGDVQQEALSFLQGLLIDDSYTVRLAGTRLVQVGGRPRSALLCLPALCSRQLIPSSHCTTVSWSRLTVFNFTLADCPSACLLASPDCLQVLLERFSNPLGVFANLKQGLSLRSTAIQERDNEQQHIETSLFMLGALSTAAVAAGAAAAAAAKQCHAHCAIRSYPKHVLHSNVPGVLPAVPASSCSRVGGLLR
jgi:hypothetical protein